MSGRTVGRRVAALVCLGALALAAAIVPAMHAEVHAREAEADAQAALPPPRAPGPVVRVTHAVSTEIDGAAHRHADGSLHTHAHHHHDGDRPGQHGADAPEHLSFAIAAAAPPIVPPPFVACETRLSIEIRSIASSRQLETQRSRGPPASA